MNPKLDFITCPDQFGTHRMAYAEWGTPSDKPTILCLHGLTRNRRDFDRLAIALAEKGRHVICPDIVGRGRSDLLREHPELYSYAQYIADMNVLLTAKNLRDVYWVGTSMGGLLGMMMAAMPETTIRRFVINDVGPFIPLAALQRIAAYVAIPTEFADEAQLERYAKQIYEPFGIVREEDWKHMVAISQWKKPDGKLTLAHDPAIARNFATLDQDVDIWKIYDAITCPILLLRGEKSDVLPAATAKDMTERGPKAKLITYSGVGHAPALMDDKQIADIVGFLS